MTDIPDLIARVRELDAAATKGPWDSEYDGDRYGFLGYVIVVDTCYEEHATDAALIAYYRTAAPLLADECERLRERVARLEEALRDLDEFGHLTCIVDPACGCCTKCDARAALEGKP